MHDRGRTWAWRAAIAGLGALAAGGCVDLEAGLSKPLPAFDAGIGGLPMETGPAPDAPRDAPPAVRDAGDFDVGMPEFTVVYTNVIQPRCTCHTRQPVLGNLDLTSENKAYNNLVGFPPGSAVAQGPACSTTLRPRVVPGDPGASLLWQKVQDFESRIRCGARMPLGQSPLPYAEVVLITEWIRQGAR